MSLEDLDSMKKTQLVELSKERGVSSTGKKADLQERLRAAMKKEEVEPDFPTGDGEGEAAEGEEEVEEEAVEQEETASTENMEDAAKDEKQEEVQVEEEKPATPTKATTTA